MPGTSANYGFHVDEFDMMFNDGGFHHGGFEHGGEPDTGAAFPHRPAVSAPVEPKVSVDQLRHPLTEKARRVLVVAWRFAQKDDHARAIATLREGMAKTAALVPYAHVLLGIEYLRAGRNAEALPEFAEAALSFPHDAAVHSNFAVSLCIMGQFEHAEQEVRLALYLEPESSPAQELLRMIEADKAAQARR